MIIESIEKDRKKYRVKIDSVSLVLYASEIKEYSLTEGMEVEDELLETLICEVVGKRATKRAMHLLEKQDMTENKLREKLKSNEYPGRCIDMAVDYVKSYHYLDDLRYCVNYIEYHSETKSRVKIRYDLMARGASKDTIDEAFAECGEIEETEQIKRWLEKKNFAAVSNDEKERYRIYSFLVRKGYRTSDILHVMNLY